MQIAWECRIPQSPRFNLLGKRPHRCPGSHLVPSRHLHTPLQTLSLSEDSGPILKNMFQLLLLLLAIYTSIYTYLQIWSHQTNTMAHNYINYMKNKTNMSQAQPDTVPCFRRLGLQTTVLNLDCNICRPAEIPLSHSEYTQISSAYITTEYIFD